MKLYYVPVSPNSRKAHAVAIQLDLPLDLKLINLPKGEQRTLEFALEPYPHIQAWYARIEQLPAWQQTNPRG